MRETRGASSRRGGGAAAAAAPELPAAALFLIFNALVDDYESFGAALLVNRQWRRAGRDPRLSFWATLELSRWSALHSLKNLQWTDPAPKYSLPFCTCTFIGAVEAGVLSGSLRAITLRGSRRPEAPPTAPVGAWLNTPLCNCSTTWWNGCVYEYGVRRAESKNGCDRLGPVSTLPLGLTSAGAHRLCDVLCDERSRVTRVDLGGNNIGDYGVEAFADVLRDNDTLSVLLLDGNNISSRRRLHSFAEALCENTTLTELSLSKNALGDGGATEVAEALYQNRTALRVLHLSECGIGSEGVDLLVHALIYNHSLTSLDLSHNPLGPGPGATRFRQALAANTSLLSLDLHHCRQMEEEGFRMVCEGLVQPSCALTTLDLSSYYDPALAAVYDGHGADYLSQALARNRTLTLLDFSAGGVVDEDAARLATALAENTTLRTLFLADNYIADEGMDALAAALRVNRSLLQLDLSRNLYREPGMASMVAALAVNTTLQALTLDNSLHFHSGPAAMEAFEAAWAARPRDPAFKPATRMHVAA